MPSQLLGFGRNVQWTDFVAQPPPNSPHHAHIETGYRLEYKSVIRPGNVQLKDDVKVRIRLFQDKSWAKKAEMDSWPAKAKGDLLRHEQGHYDITALMGRDLFIDVMELKQKSFPDQPALDRAVEEIDQRYDPQPIQDKYDHSQETDHGLKAPQQAAWDKYIQTAFTVPRAPAVHAPDGHVYKVRLLDVLTAAGKLP